MYVFSILFISSFLVFYIAIYYFINSINKLPIKILFLYDIILTSFL